MRPTALVAIAGAALASRLVSAQCEPQFLTGPDQQYPGINGTVIASTSWDPDGPGPRPPLLVVGGDFSIAGSVFANNIAAWDGQNWRPLHQGTSGPVFALTTFGDDLIAGGSFEAAGQVTVNHVARWDGTQWHALGPGMTTTPGFSLLRREAPVAALAVYNGGLIAAGGFSHAGAVPAANIARWDGTSWHALGEGISGSSRPVAVMAVHQGALFVGGPLSSAGGVAAYRLARWDGANWHALHAAGPNGRVYSLASFENDLLIGGAFSLIGETVYASVARWDGAALTPFGTDELFAQNNDPPPVYALTVHDGALYAGGDFITLTDPPAERAHFVARWDGARWRPITAAPLLAPALTLTPHAGRLAAAIADDNANVLELENDRWQPLSRGLGSLTSLAIYQGELIAAGSLEQAGTEPAMCVARWDSRRWDDLDLTRFWQIEALAFFGGQLVVGGYGYFGSADGSSAGVFQWDGARWTGLGPPTSGDPDDIHVHAMTVSNGSLVVGGLFPKISNLTASNVARWDGAAWHAMGVGLPARVTALTDFTDQPVAVHNWNTVSVFNGSSWQPLGVASSDVYAVLAHDGVLIAGGTFQSIDGVSASRIARWDGAQWTALAGGLPHPVETLTTVRADLVAIGSTAVGPDWTGHISRLHGGAWTTYSFPANAPIAAAIEYNDHLILGGEFTAIDGRVSAFWTRWSFPSADFNHDGDAGTDSDIEAFFACINGDCCPGCGTPDLDNDGLAGTQADIEAFFRVLGQGSC